MRGLVLREVAVTGSTDGEWDLKRTLGTVGAMGAGIALIVYLRRERRRLAGLGKKQGVHPMEGGGADMVEGPSGDRQLPNGVPRSLSGRSYGRSDSGRSQGSDLINRRRVAFTMDGHTDSGLRCTRLTNAPSYRPLQRVVEDREPFDIEGVTDCDALMALWALNFALPYCGTVSKAWRQHRSLESWTALERPGGCQPTTAALERWASCLGRQSPLALRLSQFLGSISSERVHVEVCQLSPRSNCRLSISYYS